MHHVVYTLFGATGDLTMRKLMPAFYNLYARGLVEETVTFLALGRREWSREDYLSEIEPWIRQFARFKVTDEMFTEFAKRVDYLEMNFTKQADYLTLFRYYDEHQYDDRQPMRYLFYFAVAPEFFPVISDNLLETGCLRGQCRVVIEKPFGSNLDDAREITNKLSAAFGIDQIYHIDHYLGKEMVQNIMTLRRENALFRAAWNRESIESVEINALEELDIGNRGAYYDATGALKDMIQGHLFQVMTIVAMEPVNQNDTDALQTAQAALLQALRPPEDDIRSQLALGQYEGYRDTPHVAPDSETETYAALKVHIDNDRWQGVPFYLRSGKALAERKTFVTINFKQIGENPHTDRLHIEIQPQEGIALSFIIKKPGSRDETTEVNMNFCQSCNLEAHSNTPEAYERLLLAAYEGQREFFTPWEQIVRSWTWMHELREKRDEAGLKPEIYARGSWGPSGADALLAASGHSWTNETETLT